MNRVMRASAVLVLVVGLAPAAVADQNFEGSQTWDFGNPTIGGSFTAWAIVGQTPTELSAEAGITAYLSLLGNNFDALSIEASSTITNGNAEQNSFVVQAAGFTVFEFNQGYDWSLNWSYILPLFNVNELMMIGPVPFTLTIESAGVIQADLNLGVGFLGVGLVGQFQSVGYANASVGADLVIASVSLTGDLEFFNGTLNANATVSWIGIEALVTIDFQVVSLILTLELGVDFGIWDWSDEWELVNFTWGNFSYVLLDVSYSWFGTGTAVGDETPVDTGGTLVSSGTPILPDAPVTPIDDGSTPSAGGATPSAGGATGPTTSAGLGGGAGSSSPANPGTGAGLATAAILAPALTNVASVSSSSAVFGPVLGPTGN